MTLDPRTIPGDPALPEWVSEYRPHQIEAIDRILAEYDRGVEIVMLDAPTGSGKTLIAETVRRMLKRRSLYVATTKTLQDQISRDFPYAAVLKGRSNYATADHPELFDSRFDRLSAADCEKQRAASCINCTTMTFDDAEMLDDHDAVMDDDAGESEMHCLWCHPIARCPYEQAKVKAFAADLAVVNTAYLLAEANHVGRITKRRDLIIADECDLLESELMSHVELRITKRRRERLGLTPPSKKTVERAWVEWVYSAIPRVNAAYTKINPRSIKIKDVRERLYLKRLVERLRALAPELSSGNWVYTGYESGAITFRPVRVHEYGHDLLFKHSTRWLLMSATIIDPNEIVNSVGIQEKNWSIVSMKSTFPVENRPIRVTPIAEMTKKNRDEAWPKMAEAVKEILARHPSERILIHAVSYDLASYIFDHARDPRMGIYSAAIEREAALEHYRRTPAAVLVAPSMDRGVDLPYDQCDVCVITKIPFPNLGDKQVSARLYSPGGQLWYSVQTIRTLVQMTGRGVRSADDTCISYILDKSFITNVWKKSRHLLPEWWSEALDWQATPILKKERVTR